MLRSLSSRLVLTVLLSAFAVPLVTVAQSQDTQSVADAARRAREQKKNSAKPTKVVTEDDIPARISRPDEQVPPANNTSPAPPAASSGQPGAPANKDAAAKSADDAETAALKETITQAQKDTDLLKRDLSLNQDSFYSNPDYARDTAGKAKLDDMRQQLADKQTALDALKAKLATLKPAAPESNAPPSVPPAPQP